MNKEPSSAKWTLIIQQDFKYQIYIYHDSLLFGWDASVMPWVCVSAKLANGLLRPRQLLHDE